MLEPPSWPCPPLYPCSVPELPLLYWGLTFRFWPLIRFSLPKTILWIFRFRPWPGYRGGGRIKFMSPLVIIKGPMYQKLILLMLIFFNPNSYLKRVFDNYFYCWNIQKNTDFLLNQLLYIFTCYSMLHMYSMQNSFCAIIYYSIKISEFRRTHIV